MRLDQYLVETGTFPSRSRAVAAIKSGHVKVSGIIVKKPAFKVSGNVEISATDLHPYVSRGALKLKYALEQFDVSVDQRVCLDVGSSTGGFSEVLLESGARRVYAVDVGRDQLHKNLRNESRIVSMEQTDARNLQLGMFDPSPDLIVCDASFISLSKVLLVPLSLVSVGSELVTLVKPQFEVGRANVGKNGIVTEETAKLKALADVKTWLGTVGWDVIDECSSPITGGDGNEEYLVHAIKRPRRAFNE